VGQLKKHRLGFTVLFVCSRYPALPYRKILLIQQAQDQIGIGLLVNYQMVFVLTTIFYRGLFVVAPIVEPHSNQFSILISPFAGSGS
jgi:hypothetical protein